MSTALSGMGPPSAQPSAHKVGADAAHLRLAEMVMAIWPARAIYAAAELAIPDHLAGGALHVDEISRLTACHAPSLRRLLRALGSCGVVTEVSPDCFGLTALGSALRTDAPGSTRALVMTIAGGWQWTAWGNFLHSLRTGQSGLLKSSGLDLFSYLAAHPQEHACFNQAMIGIHGATASAVADAYDFSALDSIVDVGGGTGTLLKTILKATSHPRGVLFDLPETAKEAREAIAKEGLAGRCTVADGDFFESVPQGHDCYILAHVLHDWTDAEAIAILRNCRRAISQKGRLLIVEAVLPEGDTPHHGKLMDLLMLAVTGGVERTGREFAELLTATGFKLERIISTSTHQSIVEATPDY
jgi:ubiquinone/menaquinone biosynthesis C-methylase UbiE